MENCQKSASNNLLSMTATHSLNDKQKQPHGMAELWRLGHDVLVNCSKPHERVEHEVFPPPRQLPRQECAKEYR